MLLEMLPDSLIALREENFHCLHLASVQWSFLSHYLTFVQDIPHATEPLLPFPALKLLSLHDCKT